MWPVTRAGYPMARYFSVSSGPSLNLSLYCRTERVCTMFINKLHQLNVACDRGQISDDWILFCIRPSLNSRFIVGQNVFYDVYQ